MSPKRTARTRLYTSTLVNNDGRAESVSAEESHAGSESSSSELDYENVGDGNDEDDSDDKSEPGSDEDDLQEESDHKEQENEDKEEESEKDSGEEEKDDIDPATGLFKSELRAMQFGPSSRRARPIF